MFTKNVPLRIRADIKPRLGLLGLEYRDGRATTRRSTTTRV